MNAKKIAFNVEWTFYKYWLEWKDSSDSNIRRLSLMAKTLGIIAFDNNMFPNSIQRVIK